MSWAGGSSELPRPVAPNLLEEVRSDASLPETRPRVLARDPAAVPVADASARRLGPANDRRDHVRRARVPFRRPRRPDLLLRPAAEAGRRDRVPALPEPRRRPRLRLSRRYLS